MPASSVSILISVLAFIVAAWSSFGARNLIEIQANENHINSIRNYYVERAEIELSLECWEHYFQNRESSIIEPIEFYYSPGYDALGEYRENLSDVTTEWELEKNMEAIIYWELEHTYMYLEYQHKLKTYKSAMNLDLLSQTIDVCGEYNS